MAEIEAEDPTFRADLAELRAELAEHRHRLAGLFESPDSTDEAIRAAVEDIIDTRTRLERRVTDYLLTVRHKLTPGQQERLFNICAEGVRGHGRPWGRAAGKHGGRGGRGAGRSGGRAGWGRGERGSRGGWDAAEGGSRGRGGRGGGGHHGRGRPNGQDAYNLPPEDAPDSPGEAQPPDE
jgi:hypothetical protein